MPSFPRFRRARLSVLTWISLAAGTLLLIISAAVSGLAGVLMAAGLVVAVTALYSLISGRRSWAAISSRRVAAITLAGALITVIVGGSLAPENGDPDLASSASEPTATPTPTATASARPTRTPTPTPTPARFSDEAAVDPDETTPAPDAASTVAADTTVTDTTALALLATLLVKGRAPQTGYDRTGGFGSAWLDVDQNGCDTRNDILSRDLTVIVKSGDCRVMTGTLLGPYTGKTINFVRGQSTSALVQIDHVVALSNAWQTGGQQLSQAQRVSLANDPLNLLAVDGPTNSSKGDGDTATWLPPVKSYRCAYVARQVSVKATYGLWVTPAEHDAMTRILTNCPDERASTSVFTAAPVVVVPVPVVVPAPVAVPVPVAPIPVAPVAEVPAPAVVEPAPATDVFYQNCDAVRAAGAAPISTGQPGYSRKLDRDGDGVGCED